MKTDYKYFKDHIKKLGFDLNIEDYPKLKKIFQYYVKEQDINGLEHYMKQLQNCGGYALEIPACIFSENKYTFEEHVLRIQELYPFVRLLSDTNLKENEYIVKYRSGKTGHHFIKIDENGIIMEKCEADFPKKFEGWGTLENSPEAVFAVIKQDYREEKIKRLPQCNRDMFLYEDAYYFVEDDGYVDIRKKEATKPKTFKILLQESYINKKQTFTYNNKQFYFKVDRDDPEIIYICSDTQILGQFYTDGISFDIELKKDKENLVYGYQPTQPIKDKDLQKNEYEI